MKMKKQAIVLSVALSIASLTGSMASCAVNQPEPRPVTDEPARFCYQTLGEISCFSAPQPQLGQVVALPPDAPAKEKPAAPLIEPESNKTGEAQATPIALTPTTTKAK